MAKKEKKIVNITKDDKKSSDRYGKDKAGKIIKLEDKGDYKERAKKNRIIAIILWVIAIIFEIIVIICNRIAFYIISSFIIFFY